MKRKGGGIMRTWFTKKKNLTRLYSTTMSWCVNSLRDLVDCGWLLLWFLLKDIPSQNWKHGDGWSTSSIWFYHCNACVCFFYHHYFLVLVVWWFSNVLDHGLRTRPASDFYHFSCVCVRRRSSLGRSSSPVIWERSLRGFWTAPEFIKRLPR